MDTIFMNSENRKIYYPHRLSDKTDWTWSDKYVALSNLENIENIKSHTKTINWKYQLRCGMKNWRYLADHVLYQLFKIISEYILKKHGEKTDNPSIRIYVNKIENRIQFKI